MGGTSRMIVEVQPADEPRSYHVTDREGGEWVASSDDDSFVVPIDPDLDPAATRTHPPLRRHHRRRPHQRPDVLAAIALGGALGSSARYGLSRLVVVVPGDFPRATLAVNITGSLVLGFLLVLLIERFPPSRFARPFLAIGFLGSYTTYSTFAVDTVLLVHEGHAATAIGYLVVSLVGGLMAVWIGIAAGRLVPHRHHDRPDREDFTS